MTHSTVKRLTKPLDEPERQFRRLRRASWHLQQNESLDIAGRNLFDDEASSSNNTGTKPPTPPKISHEHSHPNSSGIQNPIILPAEQTGRIVDSRDILLIQRTCMLQGLRSEDPLRHIKHYLSIIGNIQADGATRDTSRLQKGEDGPEWVVRSKFEDELANFMLEKNSHTKGIGDILDQHRKEMHEKFSQILSTIGKRETLKPEAPTFAITNRSGVSTRDPFSRPLQNRHLPTTLKEQPKRKDLRASLAVKNALANLGASINLMPHSLFRRLGISKLKPTRMSIQLADRSIKYPIGVCENLFVKVSKFIFLVDFVVLEMDEDELVPIILGWPFPATTRAVIDVQEGKLSLRVGSETVTFNIGKSMKSKHSRDDYMYYADHTNKLVQEQWVDTVDHDGKWTEVEEEEDSNEVQAVSFYPRIEPVEPLEWKAPENQLKPSSIEPPKLELKKLPEHLEYAFLQENNQLPVVISSALSTVEKTKLLEVLKNHKGAIAWSIADIKGIDSSFCTHKILMEDEFKPSVQPQRRVNPNIKEVVKKEVKSSLT
ncbi:DNA-directed DNA polymerase [Tanacetum coccineum]